MVKITKLEYENEILKSGFKCRYPISKSGAKNKYYYIVDEDYSNYLKYKKNKDILGVK